MLNKRKTLESEVAKLLNGVSLRSRRLNDKEVLKAAL